MSTILDLRVTYNPNVASQRAAIAQMIRIADEMDISVSCVFGDLEVKVQGHDSTEDVLYDLQARQSRQQACLKKRKVLPIIDA